MATTDIGRAVPLLRGEYDPAQTYELNDIVSLNGSLYWHYSHEVTTNVAPQATSTWKIVLSLTEAEAYIARAESAAEEAESAKDDAVTAKTAAETASTTATGASEAATAAKDDAVTARNAAQTAETGAVEAKNAAVSAKEAAQSAASSAGTSATSAGNSAGTAEYYATNAETAAETATTKASEASASATTASSAATTATGAKTAAETAASTATTKAGEASTSATSAASSAAAAQAVKDSIPEDYSELSEDVSDLKTHLDDLEGTVYPVTYDGYSKEISCVSGTNIPKQTKQIDVNIAQGASYRIVLKDENDRINSTATIYVYENELNADAESSTYEIKPNITYEKTATKNIGWISIYLAGTSITSSGNVELDVKTNVVENEGSLIAATASLKETVDNITYNNILYRSDEKTVAGTTQYVSETILTINNPEDNTDYGIRAEKVVGNLNADPLYIYIWDSEDTRRTISTNTRDGNAYINNAKTGVGDTKISFVLYPSYTGATTSVFTGITVYKGTSAKTYLHTDAVMTNETVSEIQEIASDVVDNYNNIKPQQTTFFYIGKNLLDPETVVTGEYVNQTNGNFSTNSNYNRTGYIPITAQTSYIIKSVITDLNASVRYAFYNAQKTYISGDMVSNAKYYILNSPQNAAFIAFSSDPYFFPFMFAASATDIGYEEYDVAYILPQYIAEDVNGIALNLPDKIYATSGIECNIYFENITENWKDFAWNVECTKGMQLERGYRITPVDADAGTYALTISASPKGNLSVSKQATTTLVITAASSGSGETKKLIILGDSTTYNGTVIQKLNENFSDDAMSIVTLGTMGTSPNNHEGRSGWTLNDYFTKASITYPSPDPRGTIYNPFYNPSTQTFDAVYYFANSGIAVPDWFIINMGINDMFEFTSDNALETQIVTCIGYLEDMITSIHAVSNAIKIGVCVTIPPNDSQDAFGKAYACGQTRDRYKRNNTIWANRIIEEFGNMENSGVYIIPIHTNLDTVYNMGLESIPVNARNTETYQSAIGNGGVHPATSGYWQIADVYTAFLKGNVS